jgi:hypothetical protein
MLLLSQQGHVANKGLYTSKNLRRIGPAGWSDSDPQPSSLYGKYRY